MKARQSKNPKRRIAPITRLDETGRTALVSRLTYVGSALHKRRPGDYGFHPPVNPRPSKSICDGKRTILKSEAAELLRQGIMKGMFSNFEADEPPKYVWSVDSEGEPFEAKIGNGGYHGYRLEEEDPMRANVIDEWAKR